MFQTDDPNNTRMRKSNLVLSSTSTMMSGSSADNDRHDSDHHQSHHPPCSSPASVTASSGSPSPAPTRTYHDSEQMAAPGHHNDGSSSNHILNNSGGGGGPASRSPSKSRSSLSSWRMVLLQIMLFLRGFSIRQVCFLGGLLLFCVPYAVHRAIVTFKGSKTWVFSPSMYTERKCPAPGYPTLTTAENNNTNLKICLTTLTDEKTKNSVSSLLRRFVRWRNYDNILELTWKSKQAYADKHGYHLYDSSDIVEKGRPAQWSKIKAVQRLFAAIGSQ